jgi:hypothetical protein
MGRTGRKHPVTLSCLVEGESSCEVYFEERGRTWPRGTDPWLIGEGECVVRILRTVVVLGGGLGFQA